MVMHLLLYSSLGTKIPEYVVLSHNLYSMRSLYTGMNIPLLEASVFSNTSELRLVDVRNSKFPSESLRTALFPSLSSLAHIVFLMRYSII